MRTAVKLAWRLPVGDKLTRTAIGPNMDGAIGERDPTMDARIVHSVSVSNKKEQSTLQHKERSLKSAKDVQEHIHRREEKELIRQLTKLQDEKGRRHPEIMGSCSRSRTHSRLSGSGLDNNLSQVLQLDPSSTSRLSGERLSGGKSAHMAAVDSTFNLSSALTPYAPNAPPLKAGSSRHMASLNNRRSSDVMMRGGMVTGPSSFHPSHHNQFPHPPHRQSMVNDVGRGHVGLGVGRGRGGGSSSRHTNLGISPQLSHLSHESSQGPPLVHQPAGYGHSIKEYVEREGLNKKRPAHSYMDPKGLHRRASVNTANGDLVRGSQTTLARSTDSALLSSTGSRFVLNSTTGHHPTARPSGYAFGSGQSLHRQGESSHHVAASSQQRMVVPSRFLISRLFGGQSVAGIAEEGGQSEKEQRGAHRTGSDDSDSSTDSKPERVIKLAFADEDHHNNDSDHDRDHGSSTKVHFKDEEGNDDEVTKKTLKSHPEKGRLGKSDHVVAARKSSPTKQGERKRSDRKAASNTDDTSSLKPSPPKSKKRPNKSCHAVKLNREAHPHLLKEHGAIKQGHHGTTKGGAIQIPMETLYDLRAALGNSLHLDSTSTSVDELLACVGGVQPPYAGSSCAYDPSSSSKHNRLYRARLRALQTVNAQLEALRKKEAVDPMKNFDPLEVLRCRYLRLSKSNIDTLISMCREAGIEIDMHPHMDIEDLSKFVFDGSHQKSETPSSTSVDIKHVIV